MSNARAAWTRRLDPEGPDVPAPHKYAAKPVVVDGIRFHSTKESRRYAELRLLEKAGAITELELQPLYRIVVVELWRAVPDRRLVNCGSYSADFRYRDTTTGALVVEDTKSDATKTTTYRLKKRLVEAIHGITIREL